MQRRSFSRSIGGTLYAVALAVIIAAAVYVRLPWATNLFVDVDSGTFLSIADGMARGQVMYRDLVDHKPPGIELFLLLAYSVVGHDIPTLRLLYVGILALAALPVAFLARMAESRLAGLLAAVFYSLDPIDITLAGRISQLGLVAALLAWSAFLFVLGRRRGHDRRLLIAAGAIAGLAFVVKQPAGLLVAGMGVYLAIEALLGGRLGWSSALREKLRDAAWLWVGFLAVLAPVVLYYAIQGILPEFYFYVFQINQLGLEAASQHFDLVKATLLSRLEFFAGLVAVVVALVENRRRQPDVVGLAALWLLLNAGFLLIYVELYDHYYQALVVPLAILGGVGIGQVIRVGYEAFSQALERTRIGRSKLGRRLKRDRGTLLGLAARGLLLIVVIGWLSGGGVALVQQNRQKVVASFSGWRDSPPFAEDLAVAAKIDELTGPADAIYVLGNPGFYSLANRRPASRFLYYGWRFIQSPIKATYLDELRRALQDDSTRLIVLAESYRATIVDPSLLTVIDEKYRKVDTLPYRYHRSVTFYVHRS